MNLFAPKVRAARWARGAIGLRRASAEVSLLRPPRTG